MNLRCGCVFNCHYLIKIIFILVLFFNVASVADMASAGCSRLARIADPVVIPANELAALNRQPITRLGLFRYAQPDFKPIPFQLDEKTPDGERVLPFGDQANPGDGNQCFDGQDELVFMARDAGTRANSVIDIARAQKAVEIKVNNTNGGAGYVYLVQFSCRAPRDPVDYVHYNPKDKTVTTDFYRMRFHPDFPISINHLTAFPTAGGNGKNIVDRIKVRGDANLLFGIHLSRTEEQFTSVDLAYIDGPVRVIRRTGNRMKLVLGIPTPSAIIDNVFYREYFSLPTDLNVPFNAGLVIKDARTRTTTDLSEAARGTVFYNSNNTQGVVIDGKMSRAEKNLDLSPFNWLILLNKDADAGVHWAWMNRTIIDERLADYPPTLYYNDDQSRPDPPEQNAGHYGNTGYVINFDEPPEIENGIYRLITYFYCIPGYELGDEIRYLNILDKPLQTEINVVPVAPTG